MNKVMLNFEVNFFKNMFNLYVRVILIVSENFEFLATINFEIIINCHQLLI